MWNEVSVSFFSCTDTWFSQHCLMKCPSLLFWSDIPIFQVTSVHKCVYLFWESLLGFIQGCADICSADSSSLSSLVHSKKPWLAAYVDFWWDLNTFTMTSFKLPTWCHRMQTLEEMPSSWALESRVYFSEKPKLS